MLNVWRSLSPSMALENGLRWPEPTILVGDAAAVWPSAGVAVTLTFVAESSFRSLALLPRLLPRPGAARRAFARARGDAARAARGQPIMPCEATPAGGQFSSFMPSDRP